MAYVIRARPKVSKHLNSLGEVVWAIVEAFVSLCSLPSPPLHNAISLCSQCRTHMQCCRGCANGRPLTRASFVLTFLDSASPFLPLPRLYPALRETRLQSDGYSLLVPGCRIRVIGRPLDMGIGFNASIFLSVHLLRCVLSFLLLPPLARARPVTPVAHRPHADNCRICEFGRSVTRAAFVFTLPYRLSFWGHLCVRVN